MPRTLSALIITIFSLTMTMGSAFADEDPAGIAIGEGRGIIHLDNADIPVNAADTVVLTFEGLGDQEQIRDFYNGGTGSLGSGPGPSYGISFSSNALSLIDSDAGGSGNFGGEPSPDTVMFFLEEAAAVMNVPAGFDTGFSFFYAAALIDTPGSITVYDGLDGTGNVLATLDLPVTPQDGGDPTGFHSPFVPIGVAFNGTAMSVDFAGTENRIPSTHHEHLGSDCIGFAYVRCRSKTFPQVILKF